MNPTQKHDVSSVRCLEGQWTFWFTTMDPSLLNKRGEVVTTRLYLLVYFPDVQVSIDCRSVYTFHVLYVLKCMCFNVCGVFL